MLLRLLEVYGGLAPMVEGSAASVQNLSRTRIETDDPMSGWSSGFFCDDHHRRGIQDASECPDQTRLNGARLGSGAQVLHTRVKKIHPQMGVWNTVVNGRYRVWLRA